LSFFRELLSVHGRSLGVGTITGQTPSLHIKKLFLASAYFDYRPDLTIVKALCGSLELL